MKTLILGLGNDIMSDDAAGILVARAIRERIADGTAEVMEAAYAGWRLIDMLRGFERAIIIDAIISPQCQPGSVCRIDLDHIGSLHLQSSHGMGIREALMLARQTGQVMPERMSAYAVGVKNAYEFGLTPCPEVMERIGAIADEIVTEESLTLTQRAMVL